MSTQDDDDLKLEPPQAQPLPPQPASPPPAPASAPQQPAVQQRPEDQLQPGAGKPLVEGPPMSVGEPIPESTINRTAAFAGVGLIGIGVIVAVVVIALIVLATCLHH